MTIVRKATWKNKNKKDEYFQKCDEIQKKWEMDGSKLLLSKSQKKSGFLDFESNSEINHQNDNFYISNNGKNENKNDTRNRDRFENENDSKYNENNAASFNNTKNINFNYKNIIGNIKDNKIIKEEIESPHGVYLFKDRKTIVNYFSPNFLPPYNTDEKRKIIEKYLSKTWNEEKLEWI